AFDVVIVFYVFCFFFQAEDGIRDFHVTGVQTCALPILMIARAMMHEPKLLILDEPTAGVDIELRRSMWEFLNEMNEKGTSIILTTHYLEEAEMLCRRIAIIDRGVIKEDTTMKSFLSQLNEESFIFDLAEPIEPLHLDIIGVRFNLIDPMTLEITMDKAH